MFDKKALIIVFVLISFSCSNSFCMEVSSSLEMGEMFGLTSVPRKKLIDSITHDDQDRFTRLLNKAYSLPSVQHNVPSSLSIRDQFSVLKGVAKTRSNCLAKERDKLRAQMIPPCVCMFSFVPPSVILFLTQLCYDGNVDVDPVVYAPPCSVPAYSSSLSPIPYFLVLASLCTTTSCSTRYVIDCIYKRRVNRQIKSNQFILSELRQKKRQSL